MNSSSPKKNGGCLKVVFTVFAIFMVFIIAMLIFGKGSTKDSGETANLSTSAASAKTADPETLLSEAQVFLDGKQYLAAISKADEAIALSEDPKYQEWKAAALQALDQRKAELEASFDIKEDKVQNITFYLPKDCIQQGLVFYPYIGIQDSRKYMFLRIGYQEPVNSSLFVFMKIKVRTGEKLMDIQFNPMEKMNNVDIMGSGMTEMVDVSVKGDINKLLKTDIPAASEVLLRFEDISNNSKDYTLSDSQRQAIADILEYYSYLEE